MRSVFISHGAPTLPFEDVAARHFLEGLGSDHPRPKAIVVVSAHWETPIPMVNAVERNDTIHDFYGFPSKLYEISYSAPGSPELAGRIVDLLSGARMTVGIDRTRGLDHGAWVPLSLVYPEADVPVVQLSVQSHLGPGHHLELGRALAQLPDDDILVMASGSMTHDLSSWKGAIEREEPDWVTAFADWTDAALLEGRTCDLLAYRNAAPFAARNHPTEEHFLPLFVALGAAGSRAKVERIHSSTTYGVLRMDAYAFN